MTAALIADLKARGLLNQATADEELNEHLESGFRSLYCGFDPTADSLHIGSLVPLLALKRFQLAGHKPIALVGGATGLIGDPSFKAAERKLNGPEVVAGWVEKLKAQVSRFIDFDGDNAAEVVNNLDWVGQMNVLDFLRDVGKHFSVNSMIQKESVKQRIEREGSGISFTEFTYMLLQSYDFAELAQRESCTLQIGGSDQWGNIVGGVELARRMYSKQVFGLTLPLVTKADGTKFGKTESGTIWLDPKKTSPYAFYQFWMNTADADVYKFLRYFTFLPIEKIEEIEATDAEIQGRKTAQPVLADEVTRLVHGDEALASAKRITEALFSGDVAQLSEAELEQIKLDGLPASDLDNTGLSDKPLTSILSEAGMGQGKQVKDALGRNAVIINSTACSMDDLMKGEELFAADKALYGRFFLVKLGKKKYHLFELVK
ncbi:MAG: tyrosine--tRNA ligase [Oceanospirillaceae bacterium]|uniref:tyrosine--tRNA ligase n=1 Tax=unclassified Thalassolituus TaxID=2624967 RepID=UPI000C0A9594|nr:MULTISPECIES: tyrosine--tRNA ligase [unclassified Thalassolituus]MAK91039.1 tyrosine--tRNA ligase [Thalassolituus sp.]MAY00507.1 tyrosine--tRNA ligase [Oceanospirillaceae bacterium]MBL35790.1 tyrosine--tRNA ligase [Oceanospirillaceae bacterium]MBS53835.1 tyrosine--tRNA ligase [Oceanospirillaceae bacterium]|tara:strand:- start:756 stop:2051 length:1296 start_codon:yes stop_codon:yes gene_type:complete